MRRLHVSPLLALSGLLVASGASAAKPKAVTAVAPQGDGQPALAVGFDEQGVLRGRVCAATPCTLAGGEALELPADAQAHAAGARLRVMRIGKGRRVITVDVDDAAKGRSFVLVAAAPLDGSGKPKLLFRGWTGLTEGEFGVRHGALVQRGGPRADGSYDIVIGEQREDLTLCGRPAIVSPKLIDDKLELRPAKVQRLTESERDGALRVVAKRMPEDAPKSGYKLLRAVAATSAVGNPQSLTDGDPATSWAENRGADGRGEFVLMDAPSQLPLSAFEIVVRPTGKEPERGVAPTELWLATRDRLVHVTLPDDAWKEPGARFEIPLPAPLRSDCLAVVTESAKAAGRDSRVTIAELSARTEFDATAVDGLVGALAGGGERAEAAADALRALGPAAVGPISRAWPTLDEGGRRVALAVIDQASCAESAPLYLRALTGPYRAQRGHARDRLRRCGSASAPVLMQALKAGPPRVRPLLAGELALVAPADAVREIVPLLADADVPARRLFRKALAFATREAKAKGEVQKLLDDAALSEVATLDLLRSLGDRAGQYQPSSGRALLRVARPGASFRARYLAIGPAAALAERDPAARAWLARAMSSDPSGHVRAEAARRVPNVEVFKGELVRALSDREVRVREAALVTLEKPAGSFAARDAAKLLEDDPWPLVRRAAAAALAAHGADPSVDAALANALGDSSVAVRAASALALGERHAARHAEQVRERLEDEDEDITVRTAAAIALGLMCDTSALDVLTRYALELKNPSASAAERSLGPVALGALARIKPLDLGRRLKPLLDPKTPLLVRRAAEAALSEPGRCGPKA